MVEIFGLNKNSDEVVVGSHVFELFKTGGSFKRPPELRNDKVDCQMLNRKIAK